MLKPEDVEVERMPPESAIRKKGKMPAYTQRRQGRKSEKA